MLQILAPALTVAESAFPPPSEMNIWSLAFESTGVVFFVLIFLIFFSLTSWAIIIWKFFELRRAKISCEDFLTAFWQTKRLDQLYEEAVTIEGNPVAEVFVAGYREAEHVLKARTKSGSEESTVLTAELSGVESVERALRRAANQEITNLERLITFLATTASVTPFIGLFGTVWGIMNSFRQIGVHGAAGLAVVAPGISEALIATALGLGAAIPAVIAYNHYQNRIKVLEDEIENFTADFLNLVGRHFMSL
ncbi:MAG: protein TolQ [bacterium]